MATTTKQKSGIAAVIAAVIGSVIAVEGGYVNNPKDPGGETNYGITKAVAQQNGYTGPIKDLPKSKAEQIYEDKYINAPKFNLILEASPTVGHKVIDAGVNTGPARPAKWFQQSLNDMSRGGKDFPQIQVDGKVGPGTIGAYKALQAKRGSVASCKLMIKLLDGYQTTYYTGINNPEFTVGWITNRIGNIPLSDCDKEA